MSQARSKDYLLGGGARRSGAEASRPRERRDCLPPGLRQSSSEGFHGFFLKAVFVLIGQRLRPHGVGFESKLILLSVRQLKG